MELTHAQKQDIYENGYTVLRNAIPPILIKNSLRAINHSLGEGLPKEDIQTFRSQSYCKELKGTPVVSDLVNKTPIRDIAESAIGGGKVKPVTGGQLALRFPVMKDPPPKLHMHLDGMPTPHNGVPKDGKFHNFTMLVVVLLSRLEGPYSGNFTVWPGTHRKYQDFFQEHGAEYFLNDGLPPIEYPEPVQITGEPGDVVLVHYQVAHAAAPNCSSHIRYAAIFRLNHTRRTEPGYGDVLTDIWLEWPGIRETFEKS